MTFDWKAPDKDIWNRTIATFVVKHWRYAYTQGAFNKESITPSHDTVTNCMGIVLRWIRGRTVDIRQCRRSPDKILQKETRRKKRVLFKYRVDSLSRLLKSSKLDNLTSEIMPNVDCCSDTEWDPEETRYPSVGLEWRSEQYTKILHQIDGISFKYCSSTRGPAHACKRFDQCRNEATHTNPQASVCIRGTQVQIEKFIAIQSVNLLKNN
ncbi:uncharacterized protein MELLADRAFT_114543 [Melampsora larici-populina 98AG31]|uniref:Uncharacterized protein n=1 Tax=Melampsora larici-populina (strain 98AG31 / pathotype 3-4-7) TaxID=747676 RepID=F4SDW1_MELLP|nr:uncharacterized protein MELLADRAFT_114543 [Melampsora larici-populina 98AG31]EGF97162.1 hypothetical protein MELLADRAFT_114543 [Melampsora larici-populina 98AG31]